MTERSQQSSDLRAVLESRLGVNALRNVTAMRTWVHGLYTTAAVVSTPVIAEYGIGVGRFTAGIDNGDFPDVGTHEGSWALHDVRRLIDNASTVNITPLTPQSVPFGSLVAINTRTSRKLEKTNDAFFMVVQKDRATEEIVTLTCSVTVMWLLP